MNPEEIIVPDLDGETFGVNEAPVPPDVPGDAEGTEELTEAEAV